jgi:FMN phosphatase YigB (HAD superfamily)
MLARMTLFFGDGPRNAVVGTAAVKMKGELKQQIEDLPGRSEKQRTQAVDEVLTSLSSVLNANDIYDCATTTA